MLVRATVSLKAVIICLCLGVFEGCLAMMSLAFCDPIHLAKNDMSLSQFKSSLITNSSHVWHLSSSLLTGEPKIEGVTW